MRKNKLKKFLSLLLLFLTILNIPSILLKTYSSSLSSVLSHTMMMIALLLIFFNKSKYPSNLKFLYFISLLFYVLSMFCYEGDLQFFLIELIKYSLILFGLYIALDSANNKIILVLFLLGVLTILLDATFFRFGDVLIDGYNVTRGRYAGFYINANNASAVCMFGYSLVLVSNNKLRSLLLLLFSLMGFLTLSRSFIIFWIGINIIFSVKSFKHLKFVPYVFLILPILLIFQDFFDLRIDRFNSLVNFFTSGSIDSLIFDNSSRQDIWTKYYNHILNFPFIGNGYNSFRSGTLVDQNIGVHNTFLIIFGEAGVIPFLLFVGFFIYLLSRVYKLRSKSLLPLLIFITILLQFLVNHTFFSNGVRIFMMVFLLYILNNNRDEKYIPKTKI